MIRPRLSVTPLPGLMLPKPAFQTIVLPDKVRFSEVNVAVRVVDQPLWRVKLKGETDSVVEVTTALIVPYEYPLLDWYWLSPANDAVTVTEV